jgi:hypothetical protein
MNMPSPAVTETIGASVRVPRTVIARSKMDRFAIALSGLCLLHCLFIPVIVVLAPTFSALVLGTETTVHWIFLAFAVPTSCWALLRGFKRRRRVAALAAGLIGLVVMFLGVSHLFNPALEVPLTVLGVSLVVMAHVLNLLKVADQAP